MPLARRLTEWLLDDWRGAVGRSLVRDFTPRQVAALRRQWRCGQAAKLVLVALFAIVLVGFVVPVQEWLIRTLLAGWSAVEAVLLLAHVALGARSGVSYGWAFHHAQPRLHKGRSALRDLRYKGILALVAALILGLALVVG